MGAGANIVIGIFKRQDHRIAFILISAQNHDAGRPPPVPANNKSASGRVLVEHLQDVTSIYRDHQTNRIVEAILQAARHRGVKTAETYDLMRQLNQHPTAQHCTLYTSERQLQLGAARRCHSEANGCAWCTRTNRKNKMLRKASGKDNWVQTAVRTRQLTPSTESSYSMRRETWTRLRSWLT